MESMQKRHKNHKEIKEGLFSAGFNTNGMTLLFNVTHAVMLLGDLKFDNDEEDGQDLC